MTTVSAPSSIVSALGAGSGVDMAALARSLADAQFAPRVDRNTRRGELVERQITLASSLKGLLVQLSAGVADRIRSGDMSSQPQIGNGAVASVSRGTGVPAGTYSLEVTALAGAQTLASLPFAAPDAPVGGGQLTLRFGSHAAGSFAADPARPPVTVTVPANATLADTAGAINASRAGITAYVAQAADGARLVLKGQDGASSGFVVEAAGDPALAALAWDGASQPDRLLTRAADAAFTLDGLAMTSRSNIVADVAPGLSLALTATNPGAPTTIRFTNPAAAVGQFMTDLVGALNELAAELGKGLAPGSGELARDSGARSLRTALSRLAGTAVLPGAGQGQPATLADLGLATNRDGTFRLDQARLDATVKASPQGVAAMFTTGVHGVLGTFDRLARSATAAGDPGSLGGSIARYTAQRRTLADEQTQIAAAQDQLRAQFVSRFAGTDARVGASRATLAMLQGQIAAWNAPRS